MFQHKACLFCIIPVQGRSESSNSGRINASLSVLQRGLLSVWASKNAPRNRRFGNYCENCGQEEVEPTEFPEEPLLPSPQRDRVWWFQTSLLFDPNAKTGLKGLSHQVSNVSLLCLAPLWLQGSSH